MLITDNGFFSLRDYLFQVKNKLSLANLTPCNAEKFINRRENTDSRDLQSLYSEVVKITLLRIPIRIASLFGLKNLSLP